MLHPSPLYCNFEGVSVTTVILAPGACGMGVRAAVLDTTSADPGDPGAPGASSKNVDLIAIRVTSELATFSDTFVLCAGCGGGKGRGTPLQARAPRKQLSTETHTHTQVLEDLFFVFLPDGAKGVVFTMNSTLWHDRYFTYSGIC